MQPPEASDTASDTLIIEPVPPIRGTSDGADSRRESDLSVITRDPKTGVTTESTVASLAGGAGSAGSAGGTAKPAPVGLRIRKRFTELDGLRGAAALFVVVFHLRKFVRDLDPPRELNLLIGGGYLMVDLFFVLSGFVLARAMLATRTTDDVTRFSLMRVRRFMPLHLTGMAIAFACVLVTWLTQHYGYQHAPGRAAFSIDKESPSGYLSATLLLQGFIGPQFAGYAAAWSLSIELWTNVLLVVAIAAVPWVHRKVLVGPAAMLLGILVLVAAADSGDNSMGWTAFGRGLAGLGTGMVVFWIYTTALARGLGSAPADPPQTGRASPARWPAIGAVLGLLGLVACMYWSKDIRFLQFVPVLPIAAVLLFCLVQPSDGPIHRLLNTRVLQWLGSRSFALYALHGPILKVVVLASGLYGLHVHNPKVAALIIVSTLSGALIAAEVGHRFIERLWTPTKAG